MANSRPNDWSNQQPGGRFWAFQDTGRGHIEQEPPYYLNGYEHEGYEEQLAGPRESEELAHDDGYLAGFHQWSAHPPGAEPDYGYAFPATGSWEEEPGSWEEGMVPPQRGTHARPPARALRGRGDLRVERPAASRSQRTLWMAAIAAVGLVAAVLAFRWADEAGPSGTPAAGSAAAGSHATAAQAGGKMPGARAASPSYRLVAANRADGFSFNATASHRMATAAATAGGATALANCLEAKGLTAGGRVASVRYAQYSDGRDVTGLSLIGFDGTFGTGAARQLWQAAGDCGALAPGAAATSAAPGPHGGTLYTGTGNPAGTTCAWATGTTAALVWFFNGMTGLTVRDPAAACQAVRSAVEARPLCRTYACCARA